MQDHEQDIYDEIASDAGVSIDHAQKAHRAKKKGQPKKNKRQKRSQKRSKQPKQKTQARQHTPQQNVVAMPTRRLSTSFSLKGSDGQEHFYEMRAVEPTRMLREALIIQSFAAQSLVGAIEQLLGARKELAAFLEDGALDSLLDFQFDQWSDFLHNHEAIELIQDLVTNLNIRSLFDDLRDAILSIPDLPDLSLTLFSDTSRDGVWLGDEDNFNLAYTQNLFEMTQAIFRAIDHNGIVPFGDMLGE